jgi:hypothetical protein
VRAKENASKQRKALLWFGWAREEARQATAVKWLGQVATLAGLGITHKVGTRHTPMCAPSHPPPRRTHIGHKTHHHLPKKKKPHKKKKPMADLFIRTHGH